MKTDPTCEAWAEIDAIVLQWIYGTIFDDLLPGVLEPDSTAYETWSKVQNIFLNNKGSRIAELEHEFNNLTLQAMSSLKAYCQRLNYLASQLNDVDFPVNENHLVLQLVCGLPYEFDTVGAYLNQTLPSWDTTCFMLQFENQHQRTRDSHSPAEIVATIDHEPPSNPTPHRGDSGNKNRQHQQRNPNRRPPTNNTFVSHNRTYNQPPWAISSTQQQSIKPQDQAHFSNVSALEPFELGAAFST